MLKHMFFGSVFINSIKANLGLATLRIFTGLSMAIGHGIGKIPPSEGFVKGVANMGFPGPQFFAWAAGISEFGGGIFLALGLMTRPASLLIGITMFAAAFIRHAGDPFASKEKALLFLVTALALTLIGAGKYSLDYFIHKKQR